MADNESTMIPETYLATLVKLLGGATTLWALYLLATILALLQGHKKQAKIIELLESIDKKLGDRK